MGQLQSLSSRTPSPVSSSSRYNRASQRKDKRKVSEAASSLLSLKKRHIDFYVADEECFTVIDADTQPESIQPTVTPTHSETESQTELTADAISQLESDNQSRIADTEDNSSDDIYSFKCYEENSEKVNFYTGLPNVGVLKLVFSLVEEQISDSSKSLSKENELLLCLVKLRMNYLFKDMAYRLKVSVSTIQRSFHTTLDILYARLNFLVRWPERDDLRKSMPMSFRKEFGTKVVVVFDCFELFTERPSSALNKVFTYSNYKHHQTVKYLIGIAPQGVVTFISEGWGGRASDKHITEKSGVLDNLLPGDIVMVDRGFNIESSVNFYQAELAIPNFTRGKSQLHPLEVENTRKIANVRIHVERVIGLVLRKFRIFEGIIPLEFIKLRTGEVTPTINKIVKVACCLTNLCSSVVPFE